MTPLVNVLCAARSSVYASIPGIEVFDKARDAWTCQSGRPIVAHPPCRFWSRWNCRASATVPTAIAEMLLGMHCAKLVRMNGGIIEQPAFSRLWDCAKLPRPSRLDDQANLAWSCQIDQAEFGHHSHKATWLCFFGLPKDRVNWHGWTLANPRRHNLARLTPGQRSYTPARLARWLVDHASRCQPMRS